MMFKNLLLILNSKLWSEKNHELDAIDENSIPLIIF